MQDAPARECGCAEWDVRCAHLDGWSLQLVDDAKQGGYLLAPYCVALFPPHEERPVDAAKVYYYGSDYDAAVAAFHAAESELLEAGQDG